MQRPELGTPKLNWAVTRPILKLFISGGGQLRTKDLGLRTVAPIKHSFSIYIKKKFFVTPNLRCIIVRKHIARYYQQFFVKKSWNDEKKFWISVKKIIEPFAEIFLNVLRGLPWDSPNTLKHFSEKCFFSS